AVSTVSYGSYVLQRLARGRGGVLLSGLLGGVYSSTVTTVALAKQAARSPMARLFSGAILAASGVMFVRLAVLLALFNRALLALLGVVDVDPFILGLAQTAADDTGLAQAAQSILVAASSNNLAKGVYAVGFGGRAMWRALALLAALAALGLVPLLWVR